MGRLGIDYQEVVESIYELQGENKSPSVENIRSVLGTGSKTTISRHLKAWRQSNDINSHTSAANHLPEDLLALVKGLWRAMENKQASKIESLQNDYKEKEDTLNDKLNAEVYEKNELSHNIQDLTTTLNDSKSHNTLLQQTMVPSRLSPNVEEAMGNTVF